MKKIAILIYTFISVFTLIGCDIVLNQPNPPVPTGIDTIDAPFERFFNDAQSKSITIRVTKSEWQKLDDYMVEYHERFGNYRDDRYVIADAVYQDEEGSIEIPYIGLRTRGNLSRMRIVDEDGNPQLSHFKISFDQTFDLTPFSPEYDQIRSRRVFGMEEIDLKYNRNNDETFITEKYAHDMFRAYGVLAQQTTLVKLYMEIDGVTYFYGLYTAFEPIDRHFLRRRFDDDHAEGNLYKNLWQQFGPATLKNDFHPNAIGIRNVQTNYRPAYDLKTNKSIANHDELIDFIANINNLSGEAFRMYIQTHFDVDRFLRLLAVGALNGNPDDYRAMANNYYLYHDPVGDVWHMIPYDYDHGMGQGWDGLGNYSLDLDLIDWRNLTGQSHPLVEKILEIPAYRNQYIAYILELTEPNGIFTPNRFIHLFIQQMSLYDHELNEALQPLRFGLRNIEWYYQMKHEQVDQQLRND
jgi:spore coat protein H